MTITVRMREPATRSSSDPLCPEIFEVRAPRAGEAAKPLCTGPTFLDATDLAFDLLHENGHEPLEIVRVRGTEREIVWEYRPDDAVAQ